MTITHGQEIRWTARDGTITVIGDQGCATVEDAQRGALERAKSLGWTPPKWWQWWRWDDPKYEWAKRYDDKPNAEVTHAAK
jgi:hypothetical protein